MVSASVAIYEHQIIKGVDDSKTLSSKKREVLYDLIQKHSLSFSIATIDNHLIDQKNILVATMQSMKDAINAIEISVDEIIVDGHLQLSRLQRFLLHLLHLSLIA